ncbi:peptide chain release factor N(5)-glutamine methyltransferase [Lysobacter silvisoli]|uniref:Release factor glutamine methyltransferase n=1 Tax=Lysobacter silvisoli TaxID=2293254 RepID=A0A371JYX4_9GAMM|nr:peptide chain release factor N(5)-glutamine methyltransferase [Lysobacter silvisoli]RDZ26879.1 peptide chain release factor N(5)-glutamine methyltransferase [Lysobacter silvisoli]
MNRIDLLLREARGRLADGAEAELMLAYVLGQPRSWLFAYSDAAVADELAQRYRALVARRADGEPVAYLLGQRGFWSFDLRVTPATLIPRAETELLVELALARVPAGRAARIADLGTGSGAIALALARERPAAQVLATDVSAAALAVAQDNARALALANVAFREGDWYAPLQGERYELIASNPPYIAEDDAHLEQGDLRHEPRGALASGADGLDAIRVLAAGASAHLQRGGWLLIEHGWNQGDAVRGLLRDAGLVEVATERDLEGRDRVTLGRAPAG